MIDGEFKDPSETLEAIGKKKAKASGKGSNVGEGKTFNASLYIPCVSISKWNNYLNYRIL